MACTCEKEVHLKCYLLIQAAVIKAVFIVFSEMMHALKFKEPRQVSVGLLLEQRFLVAVKSTKALRLNLLTYEK